MTKVENVQYELTEQTSKAVERRYARVLFIFRHFGDEYDLDR